MALLECIDWRDVAERSDEPWNDISVRLPRVTEPGKDVHVRLPCTLLDTASISIGRGRDGDECQWHKTRLLAAAPPVALHSSNRKMRLVYRGGRLYVLRLPGSCEQWQSRPIADKVRISLSFPGPTPLEQFNGEVAPLHVCCSDDAWLVVHGAHKLPEDAVLRYRMKPHAHEQRTRVLLVGMAGRHGTDQHIPACELVPPVMLGTFLMCSLLSHGGRHHGRCDYLPSAHLEEIPGTRRTVVHREQCVECVYPCSWHEQDHKEVAKQRAALLLEMQLEGTRVPPDRGSVARDGCSIGPSARLGRQFRKQATLSGKIVKASNRLRTA